MKIENAEKIRSQIRAAKILSDLLELGHIIYMVGIVSSNATCFMFQVFVFVQRIESYRFELRTRARKKKPRTGTELSCLGLFVVSGLFVFVLHTPCIAFTPP